MKTRSSILSACLLASMVAAGGCRKKTPPAPASGATVTVTVRGAVDAEGKFEKGGFVIAGKEIAGTDADALAAALSEATAAAADKGGPVVVRVLIYPSTPYGVVRKIVAAAGRAKSAELALACIDEDDPRPKGVAFTAGKGPAGAVEVRLWPKPNTVAGLYRISDLDETLASARAVRALLATRGGEAKPGVRVRPADNVSAGLVAETIDQARRAGLGAVALGGEAMDDKAPAPPKLVVAATTIEADDEPVPTGPRPSSSFAGAAGAAYNVVFMIDRSGSMVVDFDQVRAELLKSIEALSDKQYFHVVFFGGRRPIENPTRKLIRATEANKKAAKAFIETVPSSGVTQPIPAIDRAFDVLARARKSRPGKLVYLLTDGDFSGEMRFTDNEAVLATIRTRNADKKAIIHTLLYGKRSADGEKILKTIATENGGKYLFVERSE